MSLYGTLIGESRFCKTGEYENDIYTCKIKLVYLIPEYLPIKGKRARIYYHGIAPFCIVCNNDGHVKNDCTNAPVPWADYIESLKDTGIPPSYFEPAENLVFNTSNSSNLGPLSSTPTHSSSALRSELQSLIQEAISAATGVQLPQQNQNLNNSQNQIPPSPPVIPVINPTVNPTARPRTRASVANLSGQSLGHQPTPARGRGRATRGRGRGSNGSANSNPNLARIDQGFGFGNECRFGGPSNQNEVFYPENYYPTYGPVGPFRFNYPRGRGRGRGM
jgi:hypothetical protein